VRQIVRKIVEREIVVGEELMMQNVFVVCGDGGGWWLVVSGTLRPSRPHVKSGGIRAPHWMRAGVRFSLVRCVSVSVHCCIGTPVKKDGSPDQDGKMDREKIAREFGKRVAKGHLNDRILQQTLGRFSFFFTYLAGVFCLVFAVLSLMMIAEKRIRKQLGSESVVQGFD